MGEETEAQGTYEQGLNCPLVSSRARIWTQVSNLFSSDSQPHLIPWPELVYYNAGILLKIQGFTLALKMFCSGCLRVLSQVQNSLSLKRRGGGGLQNTQWEEVSVELRAHFLVPLSALLLNSAIKSLGVFHMPPTSPPFKGRCCIMQLCFPGLRSVACRIFKAEVWVSGLNHLHRNGHLPLVLIKPRAKQPSWPPRPVHATNYQDTWTQSLTYLRYHVKEVAKALEGSHCLASYFKRPLVLQTFPAWVLLVCASRHRTSRNSTGFINKYILCKF